MYQIDKFELSISSLKYPSLFFNRIRIVLREQRSLFKSWLNALCVLVLESLYWPQNKTLLFENMVPLIESIDKNFMKPELFCYLFSLFNIEANQKDMIENNRHDKKLWSYVQANFMLTIPSLSLQHAIEKYSYVESDQ